MTPEDIKRVHASHHDRPYKHAGKVWLAVILLSIALWLGIFWAVSGLIQWAF